MPEKPTPESEELVLPWRGVVLVIPQFVQWYVQKYGPIPDDDPGLTYARYTELTAEYGRDGVA